MHGHLYFHSPCFDGIVSAVLMSDFLESRERWDSIALSPVNYHLKADWLDKPLSEPAAVVDFLYHPTAQFWADHHSTTFLTPAAERDYERRKSDRRVFQPAARSCAALLWTHLDQAFGHRNPKYQELVTWADKTDSADYASVEEALFGDAPALRIVKALGWKNDPEFCVQLVNWLCRQPLSAVAQRALTRERFEASLAATHAGLERLRRSTRLESGGVVVFDVDSRGVTINRYAPFHFFPDALYSLGVVHWDNGAKITAMRNPWREFASAPLGEIFEHEGGGGHQRVASLILAGDRVDDAQEIRSRLLTRLSEAAGQLATPRSHD